MSSTSLYPRPLRVASLNLSEAEPWVDIHRAAEHMGIKSSWLYANGDRAGIPVARVGRARRYRLTDLDRYLVGSAA